MTAVHTSPRAASSVDCPLFQRSNISTATICESGPAKRIGSDSTRAANRKMNSQPDSIAGARSGATIRRRVVNGEAPQTPAASSSS